MPHQFPAACARRTATTTRFLAILVLALARVTCHAADVSVALTGQWSFALDSLDRGEQLGWHRPAPDWTGVMPQASSGWDTATVPHDYLSDPRYQYTGVAWYRRSFAAPTAQAKGDVWRLQFAQVSQRCRVWLNGELVGRHEGGYTPFEFDVTAQIKPGQYNFLVVAVDNRVRLRALPGARTAATTSAQQFPWLNYGGILGDVRLVSHAPVYVVRQQIEATPDLAGGPGAFASHVFVRNATPQPQHATVSVRVATDVDVSREIDLAPHAEQSVTLRAALPAGMARWTLAAQPLYLARATVRSVGREHAVEDHFGFRRLEAKAGRFLLNGEPIRLAGANRARGHGKFGGLDPDEAVDEDMRLMKAAGLRFARLQHTPPQRNLLDWADRHGMLLILEVGVWGYPAADLGSAELRANFQHEMRELIALAANHPSVVGWSVGNEYESWTPEGLAWTRDMAAFVKSLDATRPVTFAALGTVLRRLRDGTDAAGPHAFDFVDLISTNVYFPPKDVPSYLDPVHARWPGKPVLITEYGLRADRVKSEQERITHFDQMLAIVRARPWVCGMSYWSFNDYPSHYPGSGADGYRRWGLVDEYRRPRALYDHIRQAVATGLD